MPTFAESSSEDSAIFLQLYKSFKKSQTQDTAYRFKAQKEEERLKIILRYLNSDDKLQKEFLDRLVNSITSDDSSFYSIGALTLDKYSGLILSILLKNNEYFQKIFNIIVKSQNISQLCQTDPMGRNALFHAMQSPEFRASALQILGAATLFVKNNSRFAPKIVSMITNQTKEDRYASSSPLIIALALYFSGIDKDILEFIINNPFFGTDIRRFICEQNHRELAFQVGFEMSRYKTEFKKFMRASEVESGINELIRQLEPAQSLTIEATRVTSIASKC